ncbi:CPBP family intramembrane metalloprotease [Pyxidicoccus parkwayensis]|uniref:CPBP family intramembrane metalloprotease n=1 Tax=Pyxidicoccus parkwayensis TaxID=2813578 RepID=A0ABX7NM72_9BACT|nr:CPBP family intramembrane glutamic endopeptidase [Pyxidicoccus parkwaysis]QSQ19498.1 CPBP family intramembrane metalloprotease [Pyxidicoccus parkwaysis]
MDSQPQASSEAGSPAPNLHATAPVGSTPPRVWTVFVAYVALLTTVAVIGTLIFGVAMIVEASRKGIKNPEDFTPLIEQLKVTPWLHAAGVMTSSTTGLVMALLLAKLSPRPWRERLRLLPGASLHPVAWVAAVVACCALGQALESASILTGVWTWSATLKGLEATSKASPGTFALLMLFGTLVAGTAEELFFRGYVQSRLVERWGRTAGIACTATLFGIIHMDPIQSPLALAIGLYLGWLAEHTGSVRLPVLVHILNNAVSFLLSRFATPSSELPTSVHVALLIVCPLLVAGALVLLRRAVAAPVVAAATAVEG